MLTINNIEVVYDRVILVLKGVSIAVSPGSITTLLGANGAGKTTTLKAISGVLYTERGAVTKGSITLEGRRVDRMRAFDVTRLGISQVFEGRRVFEHLSAEENLIAGAHLQRDARKVKSAIERVYAYFPLLRDRRNQLSGYLSGGVQQMLAIGRALMSNPKVILLDEPSLGLAPMLVRRSLPSCAGWSPNSVSPCCSSSRMRPWRSPWPTTAMSWKTAASCSKDRRTRCARTPTSRSSISASTSRARASPTTTPSTTNAANAGWHSAG